VYIFQFFRALRGFLVLCLVGILGANAFATEAANPVESKGSKTKERILFVVSSAKMHGNSQLPASISFGEVVFAWDIFNAAGYAVDFVSPNGGPVPILSDYVSDDTRARLKDPRIMDGVRNTASPPQIIPAQYRAVYYVGGSNAMYGVAEHPMLQEIAMHIFERNDGVVSAVCHGTAGIVNLKLRNGQHLIKGKRVTGYPEQHEDQSAAYLKEFPFLIGKTVQSHGGIFRVLGEDQPHVEIDGRLVTGQSYDSTTKVAEAVVEILRTQKSAPKSSLIGSGSDNEAVRTTMQTFLRGFETGDAESVGKLLQKDGLVIGYATNSGKVLSQTSQEWAKGFTGKPAADEAQRKRSFEILDVSETGAVAKVTLDYPSWKGVDYIALSKIDGKWMIVSKSWSSLSGRPAGFDPTKERDAVNAVAQNFLRAYSMADGRDLVRGVFHKDGKMVGYSARDKRIEVVGGEEFAGRFTGVDDDEDQRIRRFETLDLTHNAALVKVTIDYPRWLGLDYLALAKVDGQWKIISKSWSGRGKTVAQQN
jgi:putative intracellular protease/amidase